MQWVLEQVPLIERELKEAGPNGGNPHAECATKRRRGGLSTQRQDGDVQAGPLPGSAAGKFSKRRHDEEPDDGRPSKRPRTGPGRVPRITLAGGKHSQTPEEGHRSPVISTAQPLRRSARIAAARQASRTAPSGDTSSTIPSPYEGQCPTRRARGREGSKETAAGKPKPKGGSKTQSPGRQRR